MTVEEEIEKLRATAAIRYQMSFHFYQRGRDDNAQWLWDQMLIAHNKAEALEATLTQKENKQ